LTVEPNPSREIHASCSRCTIADKARDEVATEVRSFFGQKVYDTVIREMCGSQKPHARNPLLFTITRVREAALHGSRG